MIVPGTQQNSIKMNVVAHDFSKRLLCGSYLGDNKKDNYITEAAANYHEQFMPDEATFQIKRDDGTVVFETPGQRIRNSFHFSVGSVSRDYMTSDFFMDFIPRPIKWQIQTLRHFVHS